HYRASTLFPYTTLFRSDEDRVRIRATEELGRLKDRAIIVGIVDALCDHQHDRIDGSSPSYLAIRRDGVLLGSEKHHTIRQLGKRSEEHTSELQSRGHLV